MIKSMGKVFLNGLMEENTKGNGYLVRWGEVINKIKLKIKGNRKE